MSLFLWKVPWSRLPTRVLLRARGIDILATYPSCGMVDETIDHVLFHYSRATRVWRLATLLFIDSSMEQSTQTFLEAVRLHCKSNATLRVGIRAAYIAYQI